MAGKDDRTERVPGKAGRDRDGDDMLPLEMVASPLSHLLPPETPGPDLFARIAAAAGIGTAPPGFHVCRAGETGWKPAGEGIRLRTLSARQPGGRVAMLMEMQPGAIMPAHVHETDEECYVIAGEFEMGGEVYRSGDFLVARKGSLHPPVTTATGCLVLLGMAGGP